MMGSLLTSKLQLRSVIFQGFTQDKLYINKSYAIMSAFHPPSTALKLLISILKQNDKTPWLEMFIAPLEVGALSCTDKVANARSVPLK